MTYSLLMGIRSANMVTQNIYIKEMARRIKKGVKQYIYIYIYIYIYQTIIKVITYCLYNVEIKNIARNGTQSSREINKKCSRITIRGNKNN